MMSLIKNGQIRFLMAGLVILGTLGSAGIVAARGGYGDGGGLPLRMLWGLDLSAEQKTAIHELLPAYREEGDALRGKLHAVRETMRALMTAEVLDEDGFREASRAMAPIMEEMAVLRARFVFDLKDILTPEQTAQLQARRRTAMAHHREHRRFRQDMMDTWLQMPVDASAADPEASQ